MKKIIDMLKGTAFIWLTILALILAETLVKFMNIDAIVNVMYVMITVCAIYLLKD